MENWADYQFQWLFWDTVVVDTPDIEPLKNQKCLTISSLLIVSPNLTYEFKTAPPLPGFILLVEIIETIIVMEK